MQVFSTKFETPTSWKVDEHPRLFGQAEGGGHALANAVPVGRPRYRWSYKPVSHLGTMCRVALNWSDQMKLVVLVTLVAEASFSSSVVAIMGFALKRCIRWGQVDTSAMLYHLPMNCNPNRHTHSLKWEFSARLTFTGWMNPHLRPNYAVKWLEVARHTLSWVYFYTKKNYWSSQTNDAASLIYLFFPTIIKCCHSKRELLTLLRSKFSCVDTAVTGVTGSAQAEPTASRHRTLAALHILSPVRFRLE